ncbi:MAG: cation:proton antiporter [Candidatus Pacebacteria bacterium]|nr:cation:proton antiporter [Candidatus Paceibacterota bacterium]
MTLFIELGIIIGVAFVVSLLMTFLRQPLLIGYIITGLLVGPIIAGSISPDTFTLFSEIGIAILLFTVGLHLSPKTIKEFGKVSLITGIGQVTITSLAGYGLSLLLGFSHIESLYMSVALAFSSTIIILKLISDRGDMETLYAKISIGFLLVQDFLAIILLFTIPLLSNNDAGNTSLLFTIFQGIILIAGVLFVGFYLLPKINSFISKNTELLFLFATVWGIGIAGVFMLSGFSIETGALIAGIALSTLSSRHEISARMTPLRDFFIVMFFIVLGSHMTFGDIVSFLPQALALSLLVLIGNPIILMTIMGLLGYKKRTSLQTGFTVAQISEFSLILIAMGVTYGHISGNVLSLVTLVGIITIFGSTYFILYSEKIYSFLEPYLSIFEKKGVQEKEIPIQSYNVILFGGNRIGHDFIQTLKENQESLLVIDHNPELIKKLESQGISTLYGDVSNFDFLSSLPLASASMIISTIPNADINTLIHTTVKNQNKKAIVMVVSHDVGEALQHYNNGIDYVILPHFLGGHYASELALLIHKNPNKKEATKEAHIQSLENRLLQGHSHPL